MKYYDKLIFELSKENRVGYSLPENCYEDVALDSSLLRVTPTNLPEVSELDLVRHYTNVSKKNFGIEDGFYPLGSCTMKYNPKINESLASLSQFNQIHPLAPSTTTQGLLEIYYKLQVHLAELTGMHAYSLNTYAGAHGELAGLMIIKAYHQKRKDFKRNKIIIPDSAHGTNPASATVCGFEVVEIKSNPDGTINVAALKEHLNDSVAGLMLTNPNTAGVFEKDILEIADLIHQCGGLLYYDGANLNALLGIAKPGAMGFDITHLNLHKTFSTPHGGGGPGCGPVGVCEKLVEFLPNPVVGYKNNKYYFKNAKSSIGRLSHFYGNALVNIKAYCYILSLGYQNIKKIGPYAILNATYIKSALKDLFNLPITTNTMHEFVFDGLIDQSSGVKTLDIAKRLLDFNVHAPTIYFPLIFSQSMMIEPTESESKETLDNFIAILRQIVKESNENPEYVKNAPYTTIVRRLDEAKAARMPILTYRDLLTK